LVAVLETFFIFIFQNSEMLFCIVDVRFANRFKKTKIWKQLVHVSENSFWCFHLVFFVFLPLWRKILYYVRFAGFHFIVCVYIYILPFWLVLGPRLIFWYWWNEFVSNKLMCGSVWENCFLNNCPNEFRPVFCFHKLFSEIVHQTLL